jgi:phosphoglycerate dehydrogenase-like enzyme
LVGALWLTTQASAPAQDRTPGVAVKLVQALGLVESDRPVRDLPGWRPPRKVAIVGNAADPADLQAIAPQLTFVVLSNAADARSDISDADIVIGSCAPLLLLRAARVHWVQVMSNGVDQCLSTPLFRERGLLLTNMQRATGAIIGEHAIALALALARNLPVHLANQRQANWTYRRDGSMRTLTGKTLLVVGLGGAGIEVAKRAHALGMTVIATRASSRTGPAFVSRVGLPDELLTLARDADVIVNTAPLTPATTGLFDARFFAVLKPNAYFVNVARGQSVVNEALVAALTERRLAGAALDALDPEPLPASHALWRAPNLIITPHIADESDLPDDNKLSILRENLRRYVAGEKLLSVVGLERGY